MSLLRLPMIADGSKPSPRRDGFVTQQNSIAGGHRRQEPHQPAWLIFSANTAATVKVVDKTNASKITGAVKMEPTSVAFFGHIKVAISFPPC
jgi:hypothetical protein